MRWAQPGAAAAAAALALAAFAGGGSGGPGLVRGPAEASAPNVSSNWAGYVATGTASTTVTAGSDMAFTDVTGRWRQPAATCTPGRTSSAAVWVGLGGYSESSEKLEQAGTSADCDPAGRPTYYAWYELVPANSVTISLSIRPGDVITASVVVEGDDVIVQIKNRTRGRSFTKHLPMTAPDVTSAEWIAEAPAACGALGCRDLELTNFGSVVFSRTFAKGNGVGGTISSPNWLATAIRLVPQARRFFGEDAAPGATGPGAAPSALAPDGSGFTVSWRAHPEARAA